MTQKRAVPTLTTTPNSGSGAVFSVLVSETTGIFQSVANDAAVGGTVTGDAEL